jgi:lysozyme
MEMTMSAKGRGKLEDREGRMHNAYPDPNTGGAPWTIGVGHTGPEVHPGLVWTDAQIDAAFAIDIKRFEKAVNDPVLYSKGIRLTQNQFDALVSMAHNVGEIISSSTLIKRINANDFKGASAQFREWIIPAMIIPRRAGEWVQFNTPDGKDYPVTSQFDSRFP